MRFLLLIFMLITPLAYAGPNEVAATIGERIYVNETGGVKEKLISWNEGEEFLSLGIGHFIWYPQGTKTKVYKETFPKLLTFLQTKGIKLPYWLQKRRAAPWKCREDFLNQRHSKKFEELRQLLLRTIDLQTAFIFSHFEREVQNLLNSLPPDEKTAMELQLKRMTSSYEGLFALVDYTNFKGIGTLSSERYKQEGWGLAHVLQKMSGDEEGPVAVSEFVAAAKSVLQRRVANAPKERREERWLKGWENRLDGYLKPFEE